MSVKFDAGRAERLYLRGHTTVSVARHVGVSQAAIYRFLKGRKLLRLGAWKPPDARVARLYRDGLSRRQIGIRLGITNSKITSDLAKQGIRPEARYFRKHDIDGIIRMYRAGLALREIGRHLGIKHTGDIRRQLVDHGVPIERRRRFRKYSLETMRSAANLRSQGVTYRSISLRLGVPAGTIYDFLNRRERMRRGNGGSLGVFSSTRIPFEGFNGKGSIGNRQKSEGFRRAQSDKAKRRWADPVYHARHAAAIRKKLGRAGPPAASGR